MAQASATGQTALKGAYLSIVNLQLFSSENTITSCQRHSHTVGTNFTVTEMAFTVSDSSLLLLLIGVTTIVTIAARKMFSHDPREPPLAPQSVPLIGHMIGLSRSKFNYYVELRYVSQLQTNHEKS